VFRSQGLCLKIEQSQKSLKYTRTSERNTEKIDVRFSVAMILKGLCLWFRVHI
jgi:hypothetical protein